MTEHGRTDTLRTDEETDPTLRCSEDSLTPSRRRLLQILTGGGLIPMTGCGLFNPNESNTPLGTIDDQSTPTVSKGKGDLPHVLGQTFRAPTQQDPAKTSFYRAGRRLQNTAYSRVVKEPAGRSLRRFLRPPGMWVNDKGPLKPDAGIQYTWIREPIEVTPTEINLTIRDDAKWSDGHPITGKDLAVPPIEWTLRKWFSPPAYIPDDQIPRELEKAGEFILASFDDFEINEKSVTYRSSEGHFDNFWDTIIAAWMGSILTFSPTHIAPFDAYADAVIDTARRAQAGEIFPWYRPGKGFTDDPNLESLTAEHLADVKYVRKFSKPENVLSTGVWDLVAFDGKGFVFEPNAYHWFADTINFDTFRLEYTPSVKRERAALKADRLDYASPGITSQAVVDALPKNFKYLRVPGGGGNGLQMNFDHSALGTHEIRLALMYALDQPTIAKNIHQSVTVPVTTPGGDTWDATNYVSQGWIDQNLTTYRTNRKRAARLMREAGYTKDDGQWINGDGEPLTLSLPTTSSSATWEPAVASQLSDFGVHTQVQTLNKFVFEDRVEKGEFAIWASGVSESVASTLAIFRGAAKNPEQYGIFPENQFETGEFTDSGIPIPRTEERYRAFTIQAPPIGKPDGPLQEFHPAALALLFQTNPPPEEVRRRGKIGMWLANWFLPTIPINLQYTQHFIDEIHWQWPTNTTSWQSFINGDDTFRSPMALLGSSFLKAYPDNPEKKAK